VKTTSDIPGQESKLVQKKIGNTNGYEPEPVGSFKIWKLEERAWDKPSASSAARANDYQIIFLNFIKNADSQNGQPDDHKIYFMRGSKDLASEVTTDNLDGFYCVFEERFFSINGDALFPFSINSFSRFGNEAIINIPSDRINRFKIIFDLIYALHKSGTKHRAILIASYLIVLLQEANILFEKFNEIARSNKLSASEVLIGKFKTLIKQHYLNEHKVKAYAQMLFITPSHLNKIVKFTTGRTASDLIQERIFVDAKLLLQRSTKNISEVAYSLGFNDPSYFSRLFKMKIGVTPLNYRNL